ncbi:transcription elongation factor GreA [Candidatus Saccharibacteria bacterium]|nr:transcription elongation factor GreA [Candidatus Saccharibacteria bacterium]
MQITKAKKEELEQERKKLIARRPELAAAIATARDFGDLSENQEYTDAKQDQSIVENRISEIEELLRTSAIIKEGSKSKVELGATVVVSSRNKKSTFLIVDEVESDPLSGKISPESPLGKALLHHKSGDEVEFSAPKGKVKYKILEIK